jgi:sulfate permease, SulP family
MRRSLREAVRRAIIEHADRPGTTAVIIDAEAITFLDVTAVRMLDDVADDLARQDKQLAIAHDLGQVGDLLASEPDTALAVYPGTDEAIAAPVPEHDR